MHVRSLSAILICCALFLTSCVSETATPQAGQDPTAAATEAVSADQAKQAYPAAENNQQAQPAQAAPSINPDGYPAPDPNSGLVPAQPAATRYQVKEIDQILDILLGDKAGELAARLQYQEAPCTKDAAVGGPPKCQGDEAEGAKVMVLSTTGTPANFLRKNDENLKNLPGNVELLGAFKVKDGFVSEAYYPAGAYGIVIRTKKENQVLTLRVNPDGIVRVDYMFSPPDLGSPDIEKYLKPGG